MFKTTSLTGTGLLILVLAWSLSFFGITTDETQIAIVIHAIAICMGWAMTIIGQLRRKDMSFGIFRV